MWLKGVKISPPHQLYIYFRAFRLPMKHSLIAYIIFLSTIILLTISCTPQSCQEETAVFAGVSFYSTETGKTSPPDSVTLYGLGNSNLRIYNKAAKRSYIYLPLDASAESCRFVLIINGTADTITFDYTTFPHLISKECGYAFFHTITGCKSTGNSIDTLIVRNSRITSGNEENIRIFY